MKTDVEKEKTLLKKNDVVVALSGRDKGKKGKILEIMRDRNRAIVEGLMNVKKHQKATQANPQGGIAQKEATLHISNLALFCGHCGKPVRTAIKFLDQKKERVCRKCGESI